MIIPLNVALHVLLLCLFSICAEGRTSTSVNSNNFDYFKRPEKNKASLFNSFNQYTVDQLLVKVPSILEEPETSDSNLEISLNKEKEPPADEFSDATVPQNQNVYQNETIHSRLSTSASPEHNLLAKSSNRYRSIKRLLSQITFNCSGRAEGYYSDRDFDCRIFHYCKKNGFKFTFICPGNAVFNQEELTCDSAMRNPERTCRSSENYYFLNSVLYSKNKLPLNFETVVATANSENVTDSDTDADFGKWVNYIASTVTALPMTSQTSKASSKPKRNKVHFRKPFMSHSSMEDAQITATQTQAPMMTRSKIERHASELSVMHSPSIPDFLLTSPAPPMQQIDTPRWFPPKNASNDLAEHLNLESVNKYSQGAVEGYVVTATVSTAQDDKLKQPSEVTEVINSIDSPLASRRIPKPPTRPPNKFQISSSPPPPAKHKISNPFQVDWDDDDQMLVDEFHKQSRVPPSIIKAPVNEEAANYLFGKPMEHIPPEQIQFSPVEFESLLNKIPQELHTLPVVTSPLLNGHHHHHQMMSHFGQFASMTPPDSMSTEALQMLNGAVDVTGNGAGLDKRKSPSQIKVLFGNIVRGGHRKIGRRWLQQGTELPLISLPIGPLSRLNIGPRWNRFEPLYSPSFSPIQVIELQRRSDKSSHSRQASSWRSTLLGILSKLTNHQNKQRKL